MCIRDRDRIVSKAAISRRFFCNDSLHGLFRMDNTSIRQHSRNIAPVSYTHLIDPYSLKMQLEGGLGSCGSDSAINEEMILDEKTGKFLRCV